MRVPQSTHVKVSKIVLVLSTLLLVAALANWKHFVHHPYHDRLHDGSGVDPRVVMYRVDPRDEPVVIGDVAVDNVAVTEQQEEEQVMSIEANDGNGEAAVAVEAQPARRIDYRGMQLSNDDATPPTLGRDATGPRRAHRHGHEGFLGHRDEVPQQQQQQSGNTGIVPPHMRRHDDKKKSHSHSSSPSFDFREEDDVAADEPPTDEGFAAPQRPRHMRCRFFKRLVRAIRFHLGQAGKPALLAAIAIGAAGVVAGFTGSSCAARAWRFVIFGSFILHLVMLCQRVRDPSFCPALIDHVHQARGAMIARVTTMMVERPEQISPEKVEELRQIDGAFDEIDADPRGFCMRLVLVADFAIALHHVILLLVAGRLHKVARDAESEYEMQLEAIVGSAVVVAAAAAEGGAACGAVEMSESAPLKAVEVVV